MEAIHAPTLTLLYAGLSGLWALVLTLRVGVTRAQTGVLIGTGEGDQAEEAVVKVVRAHGNNMEYVPLLLLLMALIEMNGAPPALVNGLGITLVMGRVAHGIGLWQSTGRSPGRIAGTLATLVCLLTASSVLVYQSVQSVM